MIDYSIALFLRMQSKVILDSDSLKFENYVYNTSMKLQLILAKGHNPYENLALEQVLMDHCPSETLIFYLWQNAHTIVIGKHQHAASEIHLELAKEDHVTVSRRSSGGGAVYHDLGNLNFTFIAQDGVYSIPKQMEMIANALQALGVQAQVNGRNDIEVEGFKVSGNAFAHQNKTHLHHGTLLVNVDKALLGKYLNVNPKKLKRKNVKSVGARIANISEFKDLTIDELIDHLVEEVEKYAQTKGEWLDIESFDIKDAVARFSHPDFVFANDLKSKFIFEECFDFGCLKWEFVSKNGIITESKLFSDALENEWVEALEVHVIGALENNLSEHIKTFKFDIEDRVNLISQSFNDNLK